MKKIKILFITGYFPFCQGGAEYQALFLAQRLKTEMDVSFIFRNHYKKKEMVKDQGFTLYAIKPRQLRRFNESFILEIRQLTTLLKKIKPDVIYIRGANAYSIAANQHARKYGCRIIWHIAHDRDVIPFNNRDLLTKGLAFLNKKIVEKGLMGAQTIIAQTRHQQVLLRKNYGLESRMVVGNWHPVPPSPPKKPDKEVHILWIANWRPFKQPELFIRLAEKLRHLPSARFTMIGRHHPYPLIAQKALAKDINLMGEISNTDVNQQLAKSHILVNTSEMEGFSNTFIQAWMHRVPVVSLNVDPDQVLVQKKIGRCSGRFPQLVDDCIELIKDKSLREEMGQRARTHAVMNHSLENLEKIVSIIHK